MKHSFAYVDEKEVDIKQAQYKTNFTALLSGILIGILTNYVVLFAPQNKYGAILAVAGISFMAIFVLSLYPNTIRVCSDFSFESLAPRNPLFIDKKG